MLISVVMMTVDHRQNYLESVRSVFSVLLYPLQSIVSFPIDLGREASERMSSRQNILDENTRLRKEQLLLNAKLQKFDLLQAENMRLRELLQSSFKISERVLVAELLSIEMEPFTRQVVLNKGSRDGVYAGLPILDSGGIMGQIVHVNLLSSVAMLITDPAHAMPVQVERTGMRTIATGSGAASELEISQVPSNVDIVPGDLLVSSGLGGRFPPGYPVAVVNQVTMDPGQAFAKVTATPSARLERSREVLLVWPNRLEDESPPAAETTAQTVDGAAAPAAAQPASPAPASGADQ